MTEKTDKFKTIEKEFYQLFNNEIKNWRKVPNEYYWRATPYSTPTLFRLEDDYLELILHIIKNLSEKYNCELYLEQYSFDKINKSVNFCLVDKREEEIRKRNLDILNKKKSMAYLGL